ncbi:hypothetical protein D3C81_498810 [compost metagenome]
MNSFLRRYFPQACTLLACAALSMPASAADPTLEATIVTLDAKAFDAFNHCGEAGRLQEHATYFAPDVEFYHDQGGVTWNREAMLANTQKHVCGKFRREIVAGSQRVYPIQGFGAIEQGSHRFCQFDTGSCDGLADFTIIWKQSPAGWQMTRVLSYGHRANQ